MKKYILFGLFAIMMASCVDEYNANLGSADRNMLIVEGNIYSDSLCTFYLSHGVGLDENIWYEKDVLVNDAQVAVVGSDGSRFEGLRQSAGTYAVKTGVLSKDVKYSLEILWDGATLSSEPTLPEYCSEIENVRFYQKIDSISPNQPVEVLVSVEETRSDKAEFYRWTYTEDWEVHTKYNPYYEYDPEKDKIVWLEIHKNRGWKTGKCQEILVATNTKFQGNKVQDHRILSIENSNDRLQVLYRMDVKQYPMSKAQYEYEQARQEISDNMGGLFAPLPSVLNGNISSSDKNHRAIGYVGVCGNVATARLWINRREITFNDEFSRRIQVLDDEELLEMSDFELWNMNFRISYHDAMTGLTEWCPRSGVDATALGATFDKPAGWDEYEY